MNINEVVGLRYSNDATKVFAVLEDNREIEITENPRTQKLVMKKIVADHSIQMPSDKNDFNLMYLIKNTPKGIITIDERDMNKLKGISKKKPVEPKQLVIFKDTIKEDNQDKEVTRGYIEYTDGAIKVANKKNLPKYFEFMANKHNITEEIKGYNGLKTLVPTAVTESTKEEAGPIWEEANKKELEEKAKKTTGTKNIKIRVVAIILAGTIALGAGIYNLFQHFSKPSVDDLTRRESISDIEVNSWNARNEYYQNNPSESATPEIETETEVEEEKEDTIVDEEDTVVEENKNTNTNGNGNNGYNDGKTPPVYVTPPVEEETPNPPVDEEIPNPPVEEEKEPVYVNPETGETSTKDDEDNTITDENGNKTPIDQGIDLETGEEYTNPPTEPEETPNPPVEEEEEEKTPGTVTDPTTGKEWQEGTTESGEPVIVDPTTGEGVIVDEEPLFKSIGQIETENGVLEVEVPANILDGNNDSLIANSYTFDQEPSYFTIDNEQDTMSSGKSR